MIGYRYVVKDLSDEDRTYIYAYRKSVKEQIAKCSDFAEVRDLIYESVNTLFRYIASIEKYERSQRQPTHFESEEFDCEDFGDVSFYDNTSINRVIEELGYGTKSSDKTSIEDEFNRKLGDIIDAEEYNELKTRTLNDTLVSKQLEFMKKTEFLSEFFKNQLKTESHDQNLKFLTQNFEDAKKQKNENDTITARDKILINGTSVEKIANDYINNMVVKSFRKAEKDPHYSPIISSDKPKVGIVCGLPGMGKSTIFMNDLKRQGYMCVDLDDIAIDISNRFNLTINEKTSGSIYMLANLVHDSVVAKSMVNGYDIALEKIGYDKNQITSISKNIEKIELEVAQNIGGYPGYKQSLMMTAGSSVASAESNSIRNAIQIFRGDDIRAYHYSNLLRNNNCTTYAYMAVLSDEEIRSRFSEIRISDRIGCFNSLSMVDGEFISKRRHVEQGKINYAKRKNNFIAYN